MNIFIYVISRKSNVHQIWTFFDAFFDENGMRIKITLQKV